MMERFTDRLRKVIQLAEQEAKEWNHEYIGTEHLLLALYKEGGSLAAKLLVELGAAENQARLVTSALVQKGPDIVTTGKLPKTPRVNKVLEESNRIASQLHHNYTGTEHLLIALVEEVDGVASRILLALGVSADKLRRAVLSAVGIGVEQTGVVEWHVGIESGRAQRRQVRSVEEAAAAPREIDDRERDLRLRCVQACGGNVDHAREAFRFING